MPRYSVRLSLLTMLLTLAACADQESKGPCPKFGILRDGQQLVQFRPGGGRDATDIEHQVAITNVALSCTYSRQDTVRAVLTVDFAGETGPAATQSAVRVPYFVAVTQGDNAILAREAFSADMDLGGGGQRTTRDRVRSIRIPLAPGFTGAAYQVIVGLELSPEQVAYNRTQGAGR